MSEKGRCKEIGRCLNGNCFLYLNVDVALTGSCDGYQTARDILNIATNKTQNKK